MSYILDALKKADQERNIGDVPDLDTPHWSKRRGGHTRYWVWGGIGLLIVNAALFTVLFNRDDSAAGRPGLSADMPEQTQSKSPAPPAGSQHETIAKPQLSENSPLKPLAPPTGSQHETIAKPQQPENSPLKPLVRPDNIIAKPRKPVPRVVERLATVETPRTAAPATGVVAPVEATTAPVVEKKRAPVPVQTGAPELPEWRELSLEFRSGFNPPRLDVHVYSDDPARRFILVDLKRFVEGDTLNSGAKLEKILPGSIQLYYQGTRFRYER